MRLKGDSYWLKILVLVPLIVVVAFNALVKFIMICYCCSIRDKVTKNKIDRLHNDKPKNSPMGKATSVKDRLSSTQTIIDHNKNADDDADDATVVFDMEAPEILVSEDTCQVSLDIYCRGELKAPFRLEYFTENVSCDKDVYFDQAGVVDFPSGQNLEVSITVRFKDNIAYNPCSSFNVCLKLPDAYTYDPKAIERHAIGSMGHTVITIVNEDKFPAGGVEEHVNKCNRCWRKNKTEGEASLGEMAKSGREERGNGMRIQSYTW